MSDRTCEKCGKVFKFPALLKRHMARKTPCQLIVDPEELPPEERQKKFDCKFCGHRFSQHSSMYRHMSERCQVARSEAGLQQLYEHTRRKQKEAEKRVAELEHRLELAALAPAATAAAATGAPAEPFASHSTLHIGCLQQNTINIHMNVFGKEDCSHISRETVRALLDEVRAITSDPNLGAEAALRRAAEMIYSDRQRPENTTCYVPDPRRDDTMVHGEGGWGIHPYRAIAPTLTERAVTVLFELQPFTDIEKYGELLIALRDNEHKYKGGKQLRDMLIRNAAIIKELCAAPPQGGEA